MKIPFLDLNRMHNKIKPEILTSVEKLLDSSRFILGDETKKFEEEFAKYIGVKHAVGVGSGTDSLILAIKSLGIGEGDEIITVPNTYISTVDAISHNRATPVFVDVNEKNYNINVNAIESAITKKTKALIVVHLYGHPCDMDPIVEICEKHGLFLIEDCAQSHGATYKGKKTGTGTFGDVACFSFYPGKVMGGIGDGGMFITNSNEIAEMVAKLRNYGQSRKYFHDFIGYNSRLDSIQAAVLRIKLRHLDEYIDERRKIAKIYGEQLKSVSTPLEEAYAKHIYTYYVIRSKQRDALMQFLGKNGIGTLMHYPKPVHLQKAYEYLGLKKGKFPITEKLAGEILSLPIFPGLTDEEIAYICDKINEFKG